MNWTRTVLDGFAMAAYFNLFAGLVALYKPRLMFPGYPPAIIKAEKDPPTSAENRFYWIWICFGELLPLLLYGAVSTMEGGTTGFWPLALTGYIQWMMVNFATCSFWIFGWFRGRRKDGLSFRGPKGTPATGSTPG